MEKPPRKGGFFVGPIFAIQTNNMKKLAIAAIAGTLLVLLVVGVWLVLLLIEENYWIDRCADETSASYISDEKRRGSECAKDAGHTFGEP